MRPSSFLWSFLLLWLLPSWTGCAVQRGPFPTTARYGVNRVVLPDGLSPGDRVDILFEDGHLVSARVVDWDRSEMVADYEGQRKTHPWRDIAAVLEARGPEPPSEPSLAGAVKRFFLIIGAVALFASAAT